MKNCQHCGDIATTNLDGYDYCDTCARSAHICSHCGLKRTGLKFHGKWHCESCYATHYCSMCEQHKESVVPADNGYRCIACAMNFRTCIDCGRLVHRREGHTDRGDFLCDNCIGINWNYCDSCGAIIRSVEVRYVDDYPYCVDCAPRNQYPTRCCGGSIPGRNFEELPNRRFGIEIETDRGNYKSVPDHWGIHYDGSIDGMEIVSPILCGDEGLEEVKWIYDHCNLEFDSKCGIHIHIDVTGMTDVQRWDLVKAFIDTKGVWFNMVAPWRRDNEYCGDYLPEVRWGDDFNKYLQFIETRYCWLNLEAFKKHGTFEIRLLEGCGFEKVKTWLKMLLWFVEEVRSMSCV